MFQAGNGMTTTSLRPIVQEQKLERRRMEEVLRMILVPIVSFPPEGKDCGWRDEEWVVQ